MPFGKQDDYEWNPHLLNGGAVTSLGSQETPGRSFGPTDCIGPFKEGWETFDGKKGLFLSATRLPKGQFHRIRVIKDTKPKRAYVSFTSKDTSLTACISAPFYPERPFNQGATDAVFIYAGDYCFNPSPKRYCPIKACQTSYGWYIEIDSSGHGTYDMMVVFLQGP
jgi:hypothetical protein